MALSLAYDEKLTAWWLALMVVVHGGSTGARWLALALALAMAMTIRGSWG